MNASTASWYKPTSERGKKPMKLAKSGDKESEPSMNDKTEYNFVLMGERVAEILTKAAEDQLLEVENLVERTKILTENIKAQLSEHSIRLGDINRRVRALSESVLEAHQKFVNDK